MYSSASMFGIDPTLEPMKSPRQKIKAFRLYFRHFGVERQFLREIGIDDKNFSVMAKKKKSLWRRCARI